MRLTSPFEDGSFDVVWTQNSGMNIEDKERLYAEFYRVLRPGGRLAIQEPMAGPVQPIIFPIMWARGRQHQFPAQPGRDARRDRGAPASGSVPGTT